MHPADITSELNALTDEFFKAVSFQSGQRPGYARIRNLFIDDGKLIKNNSQAPITERFGNIAHRPSTYKKRGTMYRQAIDGSGVISTQFIRTPTGWKITSMVWDDERPGLAIPDRHT